MSPDALNYLLPALQQILVSDGGSVVEADLAQDADSVVGVLPSASAVLVPKAKAKRSDKASRTACSWQAT